MDEEGVMSLVTHTVQVALTHPENNDNNAQAAPTHPENNNITVQAARNHPENNDITVQTARTHPENNDITVQVARAHPENNDIAVQVAHTSTQHDPNTGGQDDRESAHQQDCTVSRKRKLDTRTQHPDTSSQHDLDAQLRDAVSDGRWWDVPALITSDVSEARRGWAVEEACSNADPMFVESHIIPVCTENQLSSFRLVLVRQGLWRAVRQCLDLGVSDVQRRLAVQTVSKEGDEDCVLLLLPYCPDDLLDTVLVQVTRRGLWRAAIAVLQSGVSNTQRQLAVEAACDRAEEHHLTHGILCYCHDDQMESVLTRLVERTLWGAARWLLVQSRDVLSTGTGTDTTQHTPAANEDGGDGQMSVSSILITAVKRGLWSAVRALLQHISHTTQTPDTRRWAVVEAFGDRQKDKILLYCGDNQLEATLSEVVGRVERIRDTDTSGTRRIVIVSTCASRNQKTVAAIRFCTELQRDAVRAEAESRGLCELIDDNSPELHKTESLTVIPGMWRPFCKLLTITDYTSSSETQRWAVEEACKRADDEECVAIVDVCAVDQLNTMLTEAVRRGLWKTVIWLLVRIRIADTSATHRITVEEASTRTVDGEFVAVIRFSTHAQLDSAMTEAVRRGLCKMANHDSEACKGTKPDKCVAVCFSTVALRNAVMTDAVRRGLCNRSNDGSGASDTQQWTVRTGAWETFCKLLGTVNDHIRHTSDTQRWAVEEVCKRASDNHCQHVAQFRDDDQLQTMLTEAVRRGLWKTLTRLLEQIRETRVRGFNDAIRWAVEETCKHADDDDVRKIVVFCVDSQRETLLTQAVTRGLWKTVAMLLEYHNTIRDNAQRRAVEEAYKRAADEEFHRAARCICDEHPGLAARLLWKRGMHDQALEVVEGKFKDLDSEEDALAQWAELFVDSLSTHGDGDSDATEAESELKKDLDSITHITDKSIKRVTRRTDRNTLYSAYTNKSRELFSFATSERLWSKMLSVLRANSVQHTDVYLHFFKWCVQRSGQTTSLCQLSLPLIATQTVNPALQSLARTHMWEETRRWYLQFLVEEKLWAVVKEVADYSVYDDQRAWALKQACQHKQWDVVVLLADHGLTDNHRWRVYRQVARYADWDAVRLLFKRGVDMRRMCEDLMAANPSRERPPNNIADIERRRNRGEDVSKLEVEYRERSERVARLKSEHKQRCRELDTLEKRQAARRENGNMTWYAVLSQLRQDVTEKGIEMTLQHAIQSEAWSVVVQLVRLGMNAAQRDRLFSETIRRRQWGVAMALLEHGVSVELSRAALPELMETDQWIFVARVMELSLEDTDRRRVMQTALDMKEGSVVAHGISVMEGRLMVEERQTIYDQALSQGVWQAVRRLVEEKDSTGIAQRDKALVAAVDQHRWDIVEHCVLQRADINKRNADGDTLILEKAKGEDWDSVDGLMHYGADPNMTDSEGYSAFHMTVDKAVNKWAVSGKDVWNALKTSVKFHGNLNRPNPEGHTPLYKLIYCYKEKAAEILDDALWWGSDVAQGQRVDSQGRTVLHVMCQAGRWRSIQYVMARGVNPLAVTEDADTALVVAVKYCTALKMYVEQYGEDDGRTKRDVESRGCRQKLLAECIKLGISTHQPPITDTSTVLWSSPVYISIMNRDLVVLHMLYESGACSHKELFAVFGRQPRPPYLYDWTYRYNNDLYEKDLSRYKQCLSYLKMLATTPRSLQSTCRLVISHHLGVCKPRTRQKRVKNLYLPDLMKDYVLFSDLIDPDEVTDTVSQLTMEYDTENDDSQRTKNTKTNSRIMCGNNAEGDNLNVQDWLEIYSELYVC